MNQNLKAKAKLYRWLYESSTLKSDLVLLELISSMNKIQV